MPAGSLFWEEPSRTPSPPLSSFLPCPSVLSWWVLPVTADPPNLVGATSTSEPALSRGGQERASATAGAEGILVHLLLCAPPVHLLCASSGACCYSPRCWRKPGPVYSLTALVVAQSPSLWPSEAPAPTHQPLAHFLSCLCLKRKPEAEQVRVMDNSLIFLWVSNKELCVALLPLAVKNRAHPIA